MNTQAKIQVLPPSGEAEQQWLAHLWQSEWGGDIMVTRGHEYRLSDLKSVIAKAQDELLGAATYRFDDAGGCELMSINAVSQGGGVGTALLSAVENEARRSGCWRVWLITSNDNLDALQFYQRRAYRITAVYPDAIDAARHIKPTIPLLGNHGIEIHDEIELVKLLNRAPTLPTLETERLALRSYSMDDLDFYASLWADQEVIRYIGEGVTRSWDEAKVRLERTVTGYDAGYGLLAMWHQEKHRLVGHAGLVRQEVDGKHEVELGYWVAREFWGQGLATEAAAALRNHAFDVLGLHRIISIIQPSNAASIAVAKRVGMLLERETTFKGQAVCIYAMDRKSPGRYPKRAPL